MERFDVVFSREADGDFDAILHYIARDNPLRAITFVDDLQRRIIALLTISPRAGRTFGAFRQTVFDGYIVVYAIDEAASRVNVVMISEGHRDWQRILAARGA